MNLLAISDLHLNPASEQRTGMFLRFLSRSLESGDEIVIVGDLFDLWFGKHPFEYQKSVLERMKELSAQGLALHYVEGNRDFGIGHLAGTLFRDVWSEAFELKWFGRSLYLVHGDLINTKDIPYRFWRALTKNALSLRLLDALPASFLLKRSSHLEQQMRTTNLKNKSRYPEEECSHFCMQQFQRGADLIIAGHFHAEIEKSVQIDGRNVLFYNLPGWEQGFRYLVIPPGKEKPYFQGLEN